MPQFMIVSIPYINLLNLYWIIKYLFSRNMELLINTQCPAKNSYLAAILLIEDSKTPIAAVAAAASSEGTRTVNAKIRCNPENYVEKLRQPEKKRHSISRYDNTLSIGRYKKYICHYSYIPASILYKSTAGRYRPVSYPDRPIAAHYRFM